MNKSLKKIIFLFLLFASFLCTKPIIADDTPANTSPYEVTIPAAIELDDSTNNTIEIETKIDPYYQLEIKVDSNNNFSLKDSNDHGVEYSIKHTNSDNLMNEVDLPQDVGKDYSLSHGNPNREKQSFKDTFNVEVTGTPKYSATYSDTLTYTFTSSSLYDESKTYLCFEAMGAADISFVKVGDFIDIDIPSFNYAINQNTIFTTYTLGDTISLQEGDKCFFVTSSNYGYTAKDDSNYIKFTSTSNVKASGNVMSLINTNFNSNVTLSEDYCFYGLFKDCTTLLTTPDLPATTLSEYCYSNMFNGCTSLTTLPELPTTTLADYCYEYMFNGCTSIDIRTTRDNTYQLDHRLFNEDIETFPENCSTNMLNGVPNAPATPSKETILYIEGKKYLCFEAVEATNISFVKNGTLTTTPEFKYAINQKTDWTSYTLGSTISLNPGDKCYFLASKTNNYTGESTSNYIYFKSTGNVKASGNVMSLLDPDCKYIDAEITSDYCFFYLFKSCTKLLTAPDLPATTLASYCYRSMFYGCTSLTTAPVLPATTLASYCYQCMFQNCTSLTTAPELPATTLSSYCYQCMFQNCTSLTTAPELPATTLTPYCYSNMFFGCNNLEKAPELPAETLASNCYQYMFYGCTSLTTAPELPATTLSSYCYQYMFYNCSKINYIKANFDVWKHDGSENYNENYYTYNWLYNVAKNGTFECVYYLKIKEGASYIPERWKIVKPQVIAEEATIPENCLAFRTDENDIEHSTLVSFVGGSSTAVKEVLLEYTLLTKEEYNAYKDNLSSLGEREWYKFDNLYNRDFVIPEGNIAFVQRDSSKDGSSGNEQTRTSFGNASSTVASYFRFYDPNDTSKKVSIGAQGSIMYLLDKRFTDENNSDYYNTLKDSCNFYYLFANTLLTSSPELPATTLTSCCYYYMFYGCKSLTTAPELPATTLGDSCYSSMFYGCTSLTTAPELPATTLSSSCYSSMFYGCTSLINVPNINYSTIVTKAPNYCFKNMFYNCSNLKVSSTQTDYYNTPIFKTVNTAGTDSYLNMFTNTSGTFKSTPSVNTQYYYHKPDYLSFKANEDADISFNIIGTLTTIPNLYYEKGNVINKYSFGETISLEENDVIYFYGVNNSSFSTSNSNYIKFTSTGKIEASGNIFALLNTTSLSNNTTINSSYCFAHLFDGCANLVKAPELPATTLETYCYSYMFNGCTSLVKAPVLPATTLKNYCYQYMFNGCTSLNYIYVKFTSWTSVTSPTTNWVDGVSDTGTFICPSTLTQTKDASHIPTNWTIVTGVAIAPIAKTELSYNGSSQQLITAGSGTSTGTMMYKISDTKPTDTTGFASTISSIKATDAGTYKVWYYAAASNGFTATEITDESYVEVQIAKGLPKVTTTVSGVVLTDNTIYDGINVYKYTTSGSYSTTALNSTDYTIKYGLTSDSCTSDTIPDISLNSNLADVTVYFEITIDDNYDTLKSSTNYHVLHKDTMYFENTGSAGNDIKFEELVSEGTLTDAAKTEIKYIIIDENGKATNEPAILFSDFTSPKTNSTVTLPVGAKMYLFDDNTNSDKDTHNTLNSSENDDNARVFKFTGDSTDYNIEAHGSVMSLLRKDCEAVSLGSYAFMNLFKDAKYLTTAPEIPATTLVNDCYYAMFMGCTSLTTAPALPATTLVNKCYQSMFENCSNLNSIEVDFTDWNTTGDSTTNWVDGVSSTGTFICSSELDQSNVGVSGIPTGWTIITYVDYAPIPNDCLAFRTDYIRTLDENGVVTSETEVTATNDYPVKITLTKNGSAPDVALEYTLLTKEEYNTNKDDLSKLGNVKWYSFDNNTNNSFVVPAGSIAFVQRDASKDGSTNNEQKALSSYDGYSSFKFTDPNNDSTNVNIGAQGSIMYLLDKRFTDSNNSDYYNNLTNADTYTFEDLFYKESLTTAPELPATTLAENCYDRMFNGCTSLVKAPALPATTLAGYCYRNMFNGCTSLTTAPALPATSLRVSCYYGMFNGCTSLVKAPALPATSLTNQCYYYMFQGCTKLDYIEVGFGRWYSGNCTLDWVKNVSDTGTFVCPSGSSQTTGTSYIPTGWTIITYVDSAPIPNDCLAFRTDDTDVDHDVKITLTKNGSAPDVALEYTLLTKEEYNANKDDLSKLGNAKWYSFDNNTNNSFVVPAGSIAFVQRDASKDGTTNNEQKALASNVSNYTYFKFTNLKNISTNVNIGAQGSIMYLLDKRFTDSNNSNYYNNLTNAGTYTFVYLFKGSNLTSAPELPAETLTSYCYSFMFYGCTSLTTAPELPATTLAIGCYRQMFWNCTSLTTAPTLPATALATYCYHAMFMGCTSLTTAPALPATTLVSNCYQSMFENCSNLNSIEVGFTDWNTAGNSTTNWLKDVSSTGTFVCPSGLDQSNVGVSGIPSGWTIQAPQTMTSAAPKFTMPIKSIKAYVIDECLDMGNVTISEYDEDHVIIEAISNDGYEFVSWDDGNTDNPRIIDKDAEIMEYYATFTLIEEETLEDMPNEEENVSKEDNSSQNKEELPNNEYSSYDTQSLYLPFMNSESLFLNNQRINRFF